MGDTGFDDDAGRSRSALDGRPARLAAAGVVLAAAGFLVWYERETLFPAAATVSEDPALAAYRACRDERFGDIDQMRAEGMIEDAQEKLFKSRADAMCRATNPPTR
ncbi:hypothetical protein KAJ83_06305 [Marivibrio halodurans]|uniref:Uncharacterized protein n=1 Tax=Marivibrio halodurans TaxID=2039722 RepID=A0A8J7S6R3_9PROT|nr:hypothetical protein [Marivibrio halodurans]MBP5856612.1 hypothetical protein [Marivibrio halodurans]